MPKDNSYVIFTDTSCDLPREYFDENGVPTFAMGLVMDDSEVKLTLDSPLLHSGEFYNLLRAGKEFSTTQVDMNSFYEGFERVLSEGRDIIYLSFSSALSGTYSTSCVVAGDLREKYKDRKLYMVDTKCACAGHGMIVEQAVNLQKEGVSIDELAKWLDLNIPKACHWFTVSDLNHLHRGGRLSKTAAVVGTLIGIKPVLYVDDDGRLIPYSKVRGRAQSLAALVDMAGKYGVELQNQKIYISHADAEKDAKWVGEEMKRRYNVKETQYCVMNAIIGNHSGPDTVALFFMGTKRV